MEELTGIIGFEKLKVSCFIGIEPHEQREKQDLVIDMKVQSNFAKAVETDDVNCTVNYIDLVKVCEEVARRPHFLLEKYAADVIAAICDKFEIEWVWICVRKPAAIPNASCSVVEIKKIKNSYGMDTGNGRG
jgi:7,8-dihydroneopterin aldolase/epimerase/oxygenase